VRLLSTVEEARSHMDRDDDVEGNMNVSTDMQGPAAGDGPEAGQFELECIEDEWNCNQLHAADHHLQSLTDDVRTFCADCSDSCYDNDVSTFYVNYQHQGQPVVDAVDSSATMTGVQVCGPASFELLFLIDQLASTACFVDDPGTFMTLIQTAPPPAAALYVDSSPRIVELHTDDESEHVTDNVTGHLPACTDSHYDDALLNENSAETSADATGRGAALDDSKTSTTIVYCPGEQSDMSSECRGGSRHDQQENEKRNDAEAQIQHFESLRQPRLPDIQDNVGTSQVNRDSELTTTKMAKRTDYKCQAPGRQQQQQQRRRLPPLDPRTSKADGTGDETTAGLTALHSGPTSDLGLSCQQRPQQQRVAADKYRLPDVFVDRKPPLPTAARRSELSLGRGLRLPSLNNAQRVAPREAPRMFPPPPQRRRSHPLAPRPPRTPANRNVLASRAVWPSMASGRPVEDEWTRRAAVMKRHGRLPPLQPTASVATWN